MTVKYLYGIIRNEGTSSATSFRLTGIDGGDHEVYTVGQGALAAVVSDHQGPRLTELSRRELLRRLVVHQKVIETVMREHSILPARFGTVLSSGRDLREMMRWGTHRLTAAIEKFDSHDQYEVAVTWDLPSVLDDIAGEEGIATLRAAASNLTPGESLDLRIRIGAMIKESIDRRRQEIQGDLTSELAEDTVDHQANALMGDEMVMNVAFLLHRSSLDEFLARVHRADARFDGKLNFRCIGPLPPYSFAAVEIVRPEPEKVDAALQLLELSGPISAVAVRRAFRERAAELHPDVNRSPEARELFLQLRAAESLLVDYCLANTDGNGSSEGRSCRVTRDEVERSYLVTVKRSNQ